MDGHTGPVLPHTRISSMTSILIERTLPVPGKILVRIGEQVGASQKIAQTPGRGDIRVVNVARILGLENPDLSRVMVKKRGDRVGAGETIAARRGILPFLHKPCRSPVAGRLAGIGHGWVMIETEAETLDLLAFVSGCVKAITHDLSVTVETAGAYIQGACGVGGEANGVLQVPVDGPADALAPADIGMGFNRAVLVGGASLSPEVVERARAMKVGGIIVGSISAALHDLRPPPPFPIVATEGYGHMPMSELVFDILKRLEGHQASLSARMGDPWDSTRPEIIVPLEEEAPGDAPHFHRSHDPSRPTRTGDWVRVVRQPLSGQIGEIVTLPDEPRRLPSGLSLAGAQVAFTREQCPQGVGASQFVPWLNLERISREIGSR